MLNPSFSWTSYRALYSMVEFKLSGRLWFYSSHHRSWFTIGIRSLLWFLHFFVWLAAPKMTAWYLKNILHIGMIHQLPRRSPIQGRQYCFFWIRIQPDDCKNIFRQIIQSVFFFNNCISLGESIWLQRFWVKGGLLFGHPWLTATNLSYTFSLFETSATALCGTTSMLSI